MEEELDYAFESIAACVSVIIIDIAVLIFA